MMTDLGLAAWLALLCCLSIGTTTAQDSCDDPENLAVIQSQLTTTTFQVSFDQNQCGNINITVSLRPQLCSTGTVYNITLHCVENFGAQCSTTSNGPPGSPEVHCSRPFGFTNFFCLISQVDPGQIYSMGVFTVSSAGGELGMAKLLEDVVIVPEAPANLTPVPSQTNTTSISVSWDVVGVAEQFIITATCTDVNCVDNMKMVSGDDCPQNPTATIGDLAPGAVYSLTVAAQSGDNPPAASMPVMEQTEPVPPTNVTFDLVNVTSLVVMWGSAAGVHDGYNLTCTSCEGEQARPLPLSDNHTRHQYDGLIRGEMYNFTIITVSGPKYSQPTEIIQFIDPAPVGNIAVLSLGSRNVSLEWQRPEGVYSHFIVRVTPDSGEDMLVKSNSLNVTLVDLTPGTLYNFTVYTVSGNKESVGTGYGPVTTLEEPPGPVSSLTLVATSSTTLQVSWQPPEEPNGVVTNYTLRVRNSADMEWNSTVTLVPAVPATTVTASSTMMMATTAGQPMGTSTVLPASTNQATVAVTVANTASVAPGTTNGMTPTDTPTTSALPSTMDVTTSTNAPQETTSGPVNIPSTSPMEMTARLTTVPNTFTTTPGVLPTTTATDMPPTPSPTSTDTQSSCYEEVIVISCGDGTGTYPPDAAMLQCGVSGLVPHNSYVVEVFAATAPGVGDKESSTESTLQDRPCDPPKDLVVSNTSSTSPDPNTKSVNVTWTPPTQRNGDVMYTVYITDSNNITTTINTTTATAHYVVDDLDSFSSYTVTVAAYTAVGYGPESEEVMFVTEEGVPSTSITGLQANLSATAVSLQWTPPSEPNGIIQLYEVHYNDTVDGNYTVVNTTGPEPSIVLEGLEEYWEYMVWIYTYTQMGRGSIYSTPYTLLTEEAVPGPPPISSTISTSRSIAVQWGPPSKYQQNGILQGYYLSYNTTSAGPSVLSFDSSVESYTIPDLTPYMNYTLCLWAWTSAGNGSRSCVTQETEQDVPSAPRNLAINEVHPRSITLKWDSPAETNGIILGYTIMYTMEGTSDSQEVETIETTGQISDLRAHTGYNIQVAARTVIGQGAKSEPLEVTTAIAIPGKPGNVRGMALNQSAIYVEWEEPQPYPGPTTYAVLVYDAVDDTQRGAFQAGGMTSLTVLGLKAYNSYYFVIMAMTDAGNTSSDPSAQVTTYPGAPVVDQNVKPQDGSDSTTTTLTVTFTSAMFSEENGPVASYTVFVAEDTEDLSDSPSFGHENDTTVLTWYDVRNRDPVPPYQVTEKQPYPFSHGSRSKRQASQSREFVIGEETDCESNREEFCNGPLKPGTTYRAKMRAFTENGWYADSSYSEPLKTTGETQPPRPMALAIGVGTAGGVVLLILIILTAVVCLKQRRNRRQEMVVVPPQALLDIHLPASEQQMVETSSRCVPQSIQTSTTTLVEASAHDQPGNDEAVIVKL